MHKFLFIACCFGVFVIQAQNGKKDTARSFDGGELVAPVNKGLMKSDKVLFDPTVPKKEKYNPNFTYNLSDFQWNTRKISRIFPPEKYKEKELDTAYNPNYVRIGAGNYAHKLAELFISNKANPKYAYNIAFLHLSADQPNSSNRLDPLQVRDFSTNKGFASFAKFFQGSSLTARFNYLRDMNRFFAKDTLWQGSSERARNLKKINNNMGFNLLYDKKSALQKPGFNMGFMFNNFYNNLLHSETEVAGKIGWDFQLQQLKTYGDIAVTYLKYRQISINTQQYFVDLKPRVYYVNKENGFEGWGGLNITALFKDTGDPKYYINPYVYGEKKMEGLNAKFYAGLDGGLKPNSLRRFSERVPFTLDTVKVSNTYEMFKLFAGLKGRITQNSQFNIEAGYSQTSDMPLVVTAADTMGGLQIVYDEVKNPYFSADLRFSIGEDFRLAVSGKFNDYTTTTEFDAWHLPKLQYGLLAQYNLKRKWVFEAGLQGMGARPNRDLKGNNNLSMKGFIDPHLRIDYIIANKVRIWLQGSNLTNSQYQLWYGYKNYGLTVLGGLSASF